MSNSTTISPPYMAQVNNTTINVVSAECLGGDIQVIDLAFASAVWTTDLVVYVPLITVESLLVAQFFWCNGATVSGNVDVGIYSDDGVTKLGSTGPTLAAGTSAIQVVDVTNFRLRSSSRFWMALGCDNATQAFWLANLAVNGLDCLGVKQQASGWSSGLPSSATFATPTVAKLPQFGFTGSAVL